MSRPLSPFEKLLIRFGSARRLAGFLILVLLIVLGRWIRPPVPNPEPIDSESTYRVERVVDGDTLILADSERTVVRFIGIDTPELARDDHPAEPLAEESKRWLLEQVEGKEVRLEFDIERSDQYDRTLAYVYRGETLMNEAVVRQGFSRAETRYPYSDRMKKRLRRAEELAREDRYGIWAIDRNGRGDR